MGVELLEIGVKVKKGVIFTVRGCFRSVRNHPFLVGMLCFLIFLHRSSPFIFQLLVSASPILVCTAILLGTLLSFGHPNIPEIEIEEKATFEAASIKAGVLGDTTTVVEENESHYVERLSENRWDGSEKLSGKLGEVSREEDSDDTAPLIDKSELTNGENRVANRELSDLRYEEKTEWIEERLNNHDSSDTKVSRELIESDDEKSEADSFDSEKVNVDSLDSPPRSPWARVEERENQEKEQDEDEEGSDSDSEKVNVDSLDSPPHSPWARVEERENQENEQDEDEEGSDSDSDSDRAESSSPDASMADIMPMLDELHPLLDEEAPQTVHLSRGSSDAASQKSLKSSISSHESESHDEVEAADDENEDGEDEEEADGHKDEETKSAITWTEEDQKNLMDLGSSEIERNLRLENLILRRRARKNTSLLGEINLIDFESSGLPFNIAPISTRRQNPFDLTNDYYDNSGLPPIPGSAPSVLLPRRNPFDIPYDSSEEKPDLKGDGFQEDFTSQSREPVFRRHESFNVGPSIFAPKKQDVKMRPYFVPERTISEESSSYLFQRQSSELSESKVSSTLETESITSVEDLDDKKLPENDSLPEREVVEGTKDVTETGPSGDPQLIFGEEIETEDAHQEPEVVSKVESVYEHIGHGSQSSSSSEEDSQELGRVEKTDVQVGDSQLEDVRGHYEQENTTQYLEVEGFTHGSDFEAVEPRYTRVSSSSSLSEVSERVFIDTEGEGSSMLEDRRDHGGEEPIISTQTSLESTDLNITSGSLLNVSQRAPVYDSSPRGLSKNVSSSSVASDVFPQFDLGSAPVLDQMAVSSIGSESEGSGQEIETDIPHNIEMLHDSSTSYPVAAESRPIDDVDIKEHEDANPDVSGFDQRLISESSPAAASFAPHVFVPSRSSGETFEEEHLMEKHILDEFSDSVTDKNIDNVVRSSEVKDLEQAVEHLNATDESVQSPNSDADIQHETDGKNLTSMLSAEVNTSLVDDNSVQQPDINYLNEVHASSSPVDSLLDGQITWDLNMPVVQELDHFINSPSSPKFVSVPRSAFEATTVDVKTVVDEADHIKEIDDELLSELDNIGDFSVRHLGSSATEFEKHVDHVEEESFSSTHHAEASTTRALEVHSVEVNKVEHLLHLEESREDVSVYDQDLEHISELQTYQTSRDESIEVSRKEFEEDDHGSLYQETSEAETLSKEDEVLHHSLVNHDHEDTTSGLPELVVSSIEDMNMALEKISSKESEKHVVLDSPQPKFQSHEDVFLTVPESEVLSKDDIDAAHKKPETTSMETEIVVGVADSFYQGKVDTDTTSKVEDIDQSYTQISSEAIEKPLILEAVDTDAACQTSEVEANKAEEIDMASKQTISEEIEKDVVLEPPHAELQNDEDTNSGIPEQEVQLEEDVRAVSGLKSVENVVIMEDADVSSQAQVNAGDTSEITEIEASSGETKNRDVVELVDSDIISEMPEIESSSIETINLPSKHFSSEEIENCDGLAPVDTDTTSGMPEIEASSVEAINLAFKHIVSEETKNCDVLEPLQRQLVVGETITENSEDAAPHKDPIVPISTNEASVLEVGPSKDEILGDKQMDDSITGIDGLHDSVNETEKSEESMMASTNLTPTIAVGPNKDAILYDELSSEILHDSVDRTLNVAEFGETQGAPADPSEVKGTTLPPNQVVDGEPAQLLKLESNDESVKVKADDKIALSEEGSCTKQSSAVVEELPNHEHEAPKDTHSPSSVKGKGKLSRSSSSSSSSSSSTSDSDRE